jgi:hypothetical protein
MPQAVRLTRYDVCIAHLVFIHKWCTSLVMYFSVTCYLGERTFSFLSFWTKFISLRCWVYFHFIFCYVVLMHHYFRLALYVPILFPVFCAHYTASMTSWQTIVADWSSSKD